MVLIFEGIASSGKTTLIDKLQQRLKGYKSLVTLTERETLMPLIQNTDPDIARDFLSVLTGRIKNKRAEIVLVDRLLLTHAFRTNSDLIYFSEVERTLRMMDARVIFLKIAAEQIGKRIERTGLYRGQSWRFGNNSSKINKNIYYMSQQQRLSVLANKLTLPVLAIDTTSCEWDSYVSAILLWIFSHNKSIAAA